MTTSDELRAKLADGMAAGDSAAIVALFESLVARQTVLESQQSVLQSQQQQLEEKLARRELHIRRLQRVLYGRSSEKLTHEDLRQLVLLYGGTQADADAPIPMLTAGEPAPAEPEESERSPKKKRQHPGRTKLSPDLERRVTDVLVPAQERACMSCGIEMTALPSREHERVEYIPGKFIVEVERREVLVCKQSGCRHDATTAERTEPHEVELRVGASVLAQLVESKCDDAMPIHRQCDQFARLGFELPVNTLYGYWKYATDLLLPIADAVFGTVLDDPICVALDDTGLDVLDKLRETGKFRAHLWCFCGTTPLVAYRVTKTWEADEIEPWIRGIPEQTYIQVDDYGGYSALYEDIDEKPLPLVPHARRLGCMMHVRRRFYDAYKLGDKRAGFAIELIRRLYQIEEEVRGKPPDERLSVRAQKSIPLLDAFDAWVDDMRPKLGNTGKLLEAVRYAGDQRPYIRRCFTDGRLEIDNGRVERAIREPALGRKNFLFTGSLAAAERLAAAYTLVQSCRALGISTREYLIDVIGKRAAGWPAQRLAELMPQRWAASRAAATAP